MLVNISAYRSTTYIVTANNHHLVRKTVITSDLFTPPSFYVAKQFFVITAGQPKIVFLDKIVFLILLFFFMNFLQYEDEESSGGSSPERVECDVVEAMCGWRGCGVRFPSVARLSAHVSRTHALANADGLFYCGWSGCARPQRGFNARLVSFGLLLLLLF